MKTEGTISKKTAEIEEKEENLKQAQPNTRAKRASHAKHARQHRR